MPPSLPPNTNTPHPLSDPDPDPDPRKKCWLCKGPYDADKLAEHIRVAHPLIKRFRLTPAVNSEASPSSTGSGSGEVAAQAVTEGQGEQQVQAQVEDPARLSPYEEAAQPHNQTSTQLQTHVRTQVGSEAQTQPQNQTQGHAQKDTAVNAEPDDIAEYMGDAHHQNLNEHTSGTGAATVGTNPNSSSSSSPSASPVHKAGARIHTQGQARAQGVGDAQVQHRAEVEIRTQAQRRKYTLSQGQGSTPGQGQANTQAQDRAYTPGQGQDRPYIQVQTQGIDRWKTVNERRARDVNSEDKDGKQDNGNKSGKQTRDFPSRESSPDGIQKTFQSLKKGGYGINWGGSDVRNAGDTSIRTRHGNDTGNANANANPGSMIQKQGRNLNGGYGMNGGGNGNSDTGATSTRAGYGASNGNANRGSGNPNLGGNSNPHSAIRRDQRMDIGRLIHGDGDSDAGSAAGYTKNTQPPERQPQAIRRFHDGGDGGGAAAAGEIEAAQILAQRFHDDRSRPRKPQPGRLLIVPPSPGTMGPPAPIQSGSSPASTSISNSATSSRLKRKRPSDSAEADTEYTPTRTPATTTAATSARPSNSSPQTITPRDAQGRPLTKAGVPRATRGELEAKMPGPDPDTELDSPQGDPPTGMASGPNTEAWFRAVFVAPDDMKANPPVEIVSHQSKPWETFHNELRRASKGVAGRFIEGQENGFGLEHGSWFFTFMGRGTERGGRRVWGELGGHPISYRDMASSVLGDPDRYGVIIMHVS
jgi:hypothetical protein